MGQLRLTNSAALTVTLAAVGVVVGTLNSVTESCPSWGQWSSLGIGVVLVVWAGVSWFLNSGPRVRFLRDLNARIDDIADESWEFSRHDPGKAGKAWDATREFLALHIGRTETDQRFTKPTKASEHGAELWSGKGDAVHRFLDSVVVVLREIRDDVASGRLELRSKTGDRRA